MDLARRHLRVAAGTDGTTGDAAGVWVLGSEVLQRACEMESKAGIEARVWPRSPPRNTSADA